MRLQDWVRLLPLAAVWGFSFIFMRVLAPVLGPAATTTVRIFGAGLLMCMWFSAFGPRVDWARHWKPLLVMGLLNSCIPSLFLNFTAVSLPAGYLAVINSGVPLFTAVFAALWLGEALTRRKIAGLLMGVAGVALVCSDGLRADPSGGQAAFFIAIAAAVIAIAFYGMGAVLIRRHAGDIPPTVLAGGTQFMGGLATVPLAFALAPDVAAVEQAGLTKIGLNAAALILLCSVLAYTLYYRLLRDVGPARTTTVTLLIPLFALLWSVVFLHESATPAMLAGCALVLLSTVLAIKR
ncbi:MAG: DMT family transporter [Candidatus Protistobacter heckmanni]|nr:DMT family transporter [Candidatus Protistobacter heckmanni]